MGVYATRWIPSQQVMSKSDLLLNIKLRLSRYVFCRGESLQSALRYALLNICENQWLVWRMRLNHH